MSTPESVKTQLRCLIDQANSATGNSDTDLTGAIGSLISGFGQGGMPEGLNCFTLTMTEDYPNQAGGWTMTIPHGLGKIPGFAVVMRTTGITVASHLRGWIGTDVNNLRMTNKVGINNEELSMQDSAAAWIRADETNLYCTSGSWAGSLLTGVTLLVGVLE